MQSIKKIGFSLAVLISGPVAVAQDAAVVETVNNPKLEIRQYRFSHHAKGDYDRLVLEFERRDDNTALPTATVEAGEGESTITLGGIDLTGAIPESQINEAFVKKSHYLGAISVGMDAPAGGLSLRAAHKPGANAVSAEWLSNPTRLVIDARGGATQVAHATAKPAPERETLSIERSAKYPGLSEVLCFPATAKVGLTVIFKPQTAQAEELQNIRVNTDGVNPVEGTPGSDAIVCYPKRTQIQAALSFENHSGYFMTVKPEVSAAPPPLPANPIPAPPFAGLPKTAAAPTPAPAPATTAVEGHEDDLDPGPLTMPTLPLLKGARLPATSH